MQAGAEPEREAFSKPNSQHTLLPERFKGPIDRPPKQPKVKDIYPQIIASCIAHMLVIQAGINMAYSAILLPQLMADDSPLTITKDEASWIASLMAISTPVGALVCGPFMDLLGRKVFSLVTTVPITVSWFMMAFTPNYVWPLYIARVLAGFGGGLTTVSLVYISEICSASWRPMVLCLNSVFVSLGIFLTNLLGMMLPWRIVALLAGCLSLATAAAIAGYNPESPYWLLNFRADSDKSFERAKQSLQYLYHNQEMFLAEWDRLVMVSREKRQSRSVEVKSGQLKQTATEFMKRSSFLPFFLLLIIFLFQQLSGTYPIIFYAVQIFQSIGGNFGLGLNQDSAAVLLGLIRFACSLITAGLSRTYGRRPLLILSGAGMTMSSLVAAYYFQTTSSFTSVFNKNQTFIDTSGTLNSTELSFNIAGTNSTSQLTSEGDPNASGVVGLICILIFVAMSSFGFLIIPWTLLGEILPLSIRGTGGGLICSFAYVLMFAIVKVFPFALDMFDIYGLFYFFSFTSFINTVVVYFFLPETLGKAFEEIEKHFK